MGTERNPARDRMSDIHRTVEELKVQLQDFERMREDTWVAIESAVRLIPRLEDEKSRLQEDLELTREKIAEADCSIRSLENEESKMKQDIQKDQAQISHIDDRIKAFSRMMNLEI